MGGELEVYDDVPKEEASALQITAKGAALVLPLTATNVLHTITGSAKYTWTDYSLPDGDRSRGDKRSWRVSLVLEQYIIPPDQVM